MNQTGFVTFGGRLFSCCRPSTLPPDLQSNRLSSVICKIKNSGQMHWNILNGFFGPLEPILRTLQLPFTDNRIKSNFLVRPPRAPTFSSQFYQYSLFRTSPFAFPSLQANSLPTTFVRAQFAIFVLLSVPFLSSGLHFPYISAFKCQLRSHPPCQALLPSPVKIILWIVNFIHSLDTY